MTPQNQLQVLKRLLCWRAENTNSMNMTQVNGMIADANRAAYDSLDDADRAHIRDAVSLLQANIEPPFGDAMALELLSAVAQVMEVE